MLIGWTDAGETLLGHSRVPAGASVSGSSRFDGAVVLAVTNSHGVHVLDFFVFALAAGALLVIASMRGTTGQH